MLVYFAITLTVLLGFCGLAIDVGRLELRTLQLQSSADAGAMEAASEQQRGMSNWQAGAQDAVATDATLNHLPLPAFTIAEPAGAGHYATDYSTVQVAVSQTVPTFFLGLLSKGDSSVVVSASATAMVPPCMYFLSDSLQAAGTSSLNVASAGLDTSCPIYSQYGVTVDGFAHIGGGQTKVTGQAGASNIAGRVTPAVLYSTPALPDPLAYLAAPVLSTCNHTNASYSSNVTLQPGTYCGGLTITNATATLTAGLYVVTGGANFSNAILQGDGVTLYFTRGGGSGYGTFKLQNHSQMYLSAPTDASAGGIPGILLFGDRNWVGGAQDFQFNTSTFRGDGIIYTTNTGIYDWSTDLRGNEYFNIVTANMYLFGATLTASNNYSSLIGGSPLHAPVALVQ